MFGGHIGGMVGWKGWCGCGGMVEINIGWV